MLAQGRHIHLERDKQVINALFQDVYNVAVRGLDRETRLGHHVLYAFLDD